MEDTAAILAAEGPNGQPVPVTANATANAGTNRMAVYRIGIAPWGIRYPQRALRFAKHRASPTHNAKPQDTGEESQTRSKALREGAWRDSAKRRTRTR